MPREPEIFSCDRLFPFSSRPDPFLHCIDVFKNRDQFRHEPETTDDEKVPKLLTKLRTPGHDGWAVVNRQDFQDGFDEFTGGLLKGLDWSNVFVAGGRLSSTHPPATSG